MFVLFNDDHCCLDACSALPEKNRVDCGNNTNQECAEKGCCYDHTATKSPKCYYKRGVWQFF